MKPLIFCIAFIVTVLFGGDIALARPPLIAKYDVVDASYFPNIKSGNYSPEQLAMGGNPTTAISADGEARLLIRIRTNYAGFSSAIINNVVSDGTIFPIYISRKIGDEYVSIFLYTSPIDYALNTTDASQSRSLLLNLDFILSEPCIYNGTITDCVPQVSANVGFSLQLWRPPVVLVHGLWSDPFTWNSFAARLQYGIPNLAIQFANYRSKSAASFATNKRVVDISIEQALGEYRKAGIAAAQADVVGHSMGGLLARIWTGYSNYKINPLNFFSGNVHKLITIDSPHLGSFRADQLENLKRTYPNRYAILAKGFRYTNMDIEAGAVADLSSQYSGLISSMNRLDSSVPAHTIAGTDGNGASQSCAKTRRQLELPLLIAGYSWDVGASNDMIVLSSSQVPGLAATSIGPFRFNKTFPYCHNDILEHADVADHVIKLLNSSLRPGLFFAQEFAFSALPNY